MSDAAQFTVPGCSGSFTLEVSKSEFIARCERIYSPDEALAVIEEEKVRYPDAKHCCYAWRFKDNQQLAKSTDDGEPQGTAGMPILGVLTSGEVNNAVICVTRYFGGILLGKGGLVRAYSGAASGALRASEPIVITRGSIYETVVPYSLYEPFVRMIDSGGWEIASSDFGGDVKIAVKVREDDGVRFGEAVTNLTSGKSEIVRAGECEVKIGPASFSQKN